MRNIFAVGLLVVVALALSEAQAQSSHAIIGTWEMDLERSTSGGQRIVQSFVEGEDGFIVSTRTSVNDDGTPGFIYITFKLDGEGYPVYSHNSLAQFLITGTQPTLMQAYKVVDADTLESVNTSGRTRTYRVSPDGQTLTLTTTGTNGRGEAVNGLDVFERVE